MLAAFPPPDVRAPAPVRPVEPATLKEHAPRAACGFRDNTYVGMADKDVSETQLTPRQRQGLAEGAVQIRSPLPSAPNVRLACAPFRLSHKLDSEARALRVSITSRGR